MNLLSLAERDYTSTAFYNKETTFWELHLFCDKFNDKDVYRRFTKIDIETLLDNAKRLSDALECALEDVYYE